MSTTDALLVEIAAFCDEFDIPESTFGRRAMSDGKFVERIRGGGGLTVANLDRIRAYMEGERERLRPVREKPTTKRRRPTGNHREAA